MRGLGSRLGGCGLRTGGQKAAAYLDLAGSRIECRDAINSVGVGVGNHCRGGRRHYGCGTS